MSLDDTCRERTGFLIMRKRPYEWPVDASNSTTPILASGLVTKQRTCLVFLHVRATNFPGPESITRSAQAQQRRMKCAAGKCERQGLRKRLAQH